MRASTLKHDLRVSRKSTLRLSFKAEDHDEFLDFHHRHIDVKDVTHEVLENCNVIRKK